MTKNSMQLRARLTRLVTQQADRNPGTRFLARAADAPVWPANEWERFDRFLIFGSERGTYFMRKRTLSLARAANARACIAADGPRAVRRIVEVSAMGRVVSNEPCLFALAMCVAFGNEATRAMALEAVPEVARAPGEPNRFVEYLASVRGVALGDAQDIHRGGLRGGRIAGRGRLARWRPIGRARS